MTIKRALEEVPVDPARGGARVGGRVARRIATAVAAPRRRGGAGRVVGRGCCCRRRCGGVLAAGSRGRRRGAALDRRLACRACALPAARGRAAARERRAAGPGSCRRTGRSGGSGRGGRRRGRRTGSSSSVRAANELAAVEPSSGDVRWSLARPGVSSPAWGGTRTDTRILYFARGTPSDRRRRRARRQIDGAGAGGARRVAARAARVRRGQPARGRLDDGQSGGSISEGPGASCARARAMAWSPDGRELAVATPKHVVLYRGGTDRVLDVPGVRALAYSRDGRLAVVQRNAVAVVERGARAQALHERRDGLTGSRGRRTAAGSSPRRPLPISGSSCVGRASLAVSNIARQFGGAVSLDGWVTWHLT